MNKKNFIVFIFCTLILIVGFVITTVNDDSKKINRAININENI